MSMIGRAFLILFGLCCAFAMGALTLGFAALIEPAFGRMIVYAVSALLDFAFNSAVNDEDPRRAFEMLFRMWTVLATVLAGPVTLSALIGEIGRIRSLVWYSGASGVFTALLPWIARTGFSGMGGSLTPSWGESRVTLALFLCGAMAGLAYWLVAGRSAGDDGRRKSLEGPATP